MAHKFRVQVVPHRNKDGSESASKKDYRVLDRSRGKTRTVGVESSQKRAQELIDTERERLVAQHASSHPRDTAFFRKKGTK